MNQIEALLQTLMKSAVKEKAARGVIQVDGHRFGIVIEFQGYIEAPIDITIDPIPKEPDNESTPIP